MKSAATIFLIFFLYLSGFSQGNDCNMTDHYYRILSKTGNELKTRPDISSQTIFLVPYWGKVNGCGRSIGADVVNNTFGYWQRVQYNGVEGYMFDGFFEEMDSAYDQFRDIRIMVEGYVCAPLNFDPALNWYGIYQTKTVDSLIKVEIQISKRDSSNMEEMVNEGGGMIKTNRSVWSKSLFLIGSKEPLNQSVAGFGMDTRVPLLYPGQTYSFGVPERTGREVRCVNDLQLNAIGTVTDIRYCPELVNYRLRITDTRNNYKTQDLTNDFTYRGECGMVHLYWFGDLDGDKKPDLLFSASSDNKNQVTLFLSSKAKKGDFVKKVDQWTNYNCY